MRVSVIKGRKQFTDVYTCPVPNCSIWQCEGDVINSSVLWEALSFDARVMTKCHMDTNFSRVILDSNY